MARPRQQAPRKKNLLARAAEKTKHTQSERKKTALHRSFRLSRRSELPITKKIPGGLRLMHQVLAIIVGHKSISLGLLLVFVLLLWSINGLFALSGFSDIKSVLVNGQPVLSYEGVSALLSSFFMAQNSGLSETAVIAANIISILFWLAFVWVARYEMANKITGVREALYTSGTSLVPFIILLAVIFVQAIPGFYGLSLLSNIAVGSVFTGMVEITAFTLLAILLIVVSVYFIIGTVVALQIVSLPATYPLAALRSARLLCMGRRFSILRKVSLLAIFISLLWVALLIPTLLLENSVCGDTGCWVGITILPLVYYSLLGFTLMFASTYLYVLYRALLEAREAGA